MPRESGNVGLKTKERQSKWKNPMELALYYKELIEHGMTKAKDDPNAKLFTARKLREITKIQAHDDQLKAFHDMIS